jgi:glycosyltransferase involved in cell wall biosynthesis
VWDNRRVRIVAMISVYNERRFIAACIEHLREQGVDVYLIDNESTDETLAIAERYLDRGVIGIENLPRHGVYSQRAQCGRKEELALTLDADWLIHHDADEIRVSPRRGQSLAQAIAEVDAAGYNAVNFLEFTFVPTRESPDHDHPRFLETMRWYYPFLPSFPHRLNAWKRQEGPVQLGGGHKVDFPGIAMAPSSLYMRHYLYLSAEHAREKFIARGYDPEEVEHGWFGWRARLEAEHIQLPSESELRHYEADHLLDPSNPRKRHLIEEHVPERQALSRARGRLIRRAGRRVLGRRRAHPA